MFLANPGNRFSPGPPSLGSRDAGGPIDTFGTYVSARDDVLASSPESRAYPGWNLARHDEWFVAVETAPRSVGEGDVNHAMP